MERWVVRKKDSDGIKYDITVRWGNDELYISGVGVIGKGKRKPIYIGESFSTDYSWRALGWEGRRKMIEDEVLKVVPHELMLEALKETWEKLEPKELKFRI